MGRTPQEQVAIAFPIIRENGTIFVNGEQVIKLQLELVAFRPSQELPAGLRCQWLRGAPICCSYAANTKEELAAHLKDHATQCPSIDGRFQCGFGDCSSTTQDSVSKLVRHMGSHAASKEYRCPIPGCNNEFSSMQSLKGHVNRHTLSRNYACKSRDCSAKFSTANKLKDHKESKHKDSRRFLCTSCGYSGNNRSNLKKHEKTCVERVLRPRAVMPEELVVGSQQIGVYEAGLARQPWGEMDTMDLQMRDLGMEIFPAGGEVFGQSQPQLADSMQSQMEGSLAGMEVQPQEVMGGEGQGGQPSFTADQFSTVVTNSLLPGASAASAPTDLDIFADVDFSNCEPSAADTEACNDSKSDPQLTTWAGRCMEEILKKYS